MLLGTAMHVAIGATGLITGGKIALSSDEGGTISNNGRIIGAFVGVQSNTDNGDVTLTNKGKIKGGSAEAVYVNGTGAFALKNSGLITDPENSFATAQTVTSTTTNWGTMAGAVVLGDNADSFTNFKKVGHKIISGVVTGQIDLRDGADTFHGGTKKESVNAGPGNDVVTLGAGNDRFLTFHNDGQDSANGGKGTDTLVIDVAFADGIFIVNLHATEINNGLEPLRSFEFINFSTTVLDEIISFENVVGGLERDDIYGSAGTNVIKAGGADDNLHGLGGRDTLEGGADADTFWFHALSDSRVAANKRDLILDFVSGEDKIDLTYIDANTELANDQPFHLTANGGQHKFTHDPGEIRIEKPKGLTIVSGDVNGDGKAGFSIALKGHIALVDTDFNL